MIYYEYILFVFLFGALVGSFLNVLIHRLPRSEDVVFKPSHCPKCLSKIRWYQNIPIFSYVLLRGKCNFCKSRISIRYPVVEFITALGALYFAEKYLIFGQVFYFVFYFSIFCAFVVHFAIDIEHQLLLDKINLFLLALIFPYVLFFHSWSYWLLGAGIGFGVTYLVTWGFYLLRGQVGLGGGDIKLFGVVGLMLGPVGIIHNIFLSCMLGSIVGLILIFSKIMKREHPIAFGPFIIIISSLQIFMPNTFTNMMRWAGLL